MKGCKHAEELKYTNIAVGAGHDWATFPRPSFPLGVSRNGDGAMHGGCTPRQSKVSLLAWPPIRIYILDTHWSVVHT